MSDSKNIIKTSSNKKELGQIVRFAIVGVSNFLVDFIIFNLLLRFAPDLSAVWAGIISGTFAMINSFIFNKNFTFKAKNLSFFRLVLFFLITAFGGMAMAFANRLRLYKLAQATIFSGV